MNTEQILNSLENQLKGNKELVELRNSILRLYKNKDFQKVIQDAFMVKEAARYVQTSADPAMGDRERADALAMAQASGHLKRFLAINIQLGNAAENSIPEINEAIDQVNAESQETNDE